MSQTPAVEKPRKKRRRSRRQQGVSPFVTMGVIALVVIVAILGWQMLSRPYQDPRPGTRTLGTPTAPITIEEWSDFQ